MLRQSLLLLVLGLLAGTVLGLLSGTAAYLRVIEAARTEIKVTPGSDQGPALRFDPVPALALLKRLPVQAKKAEQRYTRSSFGPSWADVDFNGCDTRNDILRRDLTDTSFVSGSACLIGSGRLIDPYTSAVVAFRRGGADSARVQIDHVVALSDAWRSGAVRLSAERRLALANDPLNLLAVEGAANRRKSDSDAASWLPHESFRCHYVARQISVKASYELWVDAEERAAMLRVLRGCPETLSMPSGL